MSEVPQDVIDRIKKLLNLVAKNYAALHVDFFATRGYNSQSEQWQAGQRFASYIRKGQRPIVLHLMFRDEGLWSTALAEESAQRDAFEAMIEDLK